MTIAILLGACSTPEDPTVGPRADGSAVDENATAAVGDGGQDAGVQSTIPGAVVASEDAPVDDQPSVNTDVSVEDRPNGTSSWAVVLAGASDPFDPLLEGVVADLDALGIGTQITNCDNGAPQALQMSPTGTFTVSVYYDTEAEAGEGLATLTEAGFSGVVASVVTSCPS